MKDSFNLRCQMLVVCLAFFPVQQMIVHSQHWRTLSALYHERDLWPEVEENVLQRILVGVAVFHEFDGVLQDASDWDKSFDRSSVGHSPRRVVVDQGVGKRFWGGGSGTSALRREFSRRATTSTIRIVVNQRGLGMRLRGIILRNQKRFKAALQGHKKGSPP